jgi:TPR repeat protein
LTPLTNPQKMSRMRRRAFNGGERWYPSPSTPLGAAALGAAALGAALLGACARAPSSKPLAGAERPAQGREASAVKRPERPAAEAPVRVADAEALYERACNLGSALACNRLGVAREHDVERAIPLFERSCTLGLTRGCTNLAYMLTQDPARVGQGAALFEKSCQASDAIACAGLADLHYSGGGIPKDDARAFASYERACALEHWTACASSGWMMRRQEGGARDRKLALARFRAGCEHRDYRSCYGLGVAMVEDAQNQHETARGEEWLDFACEHGELGACVFLGFRLILPDGTIPIAAQRSLTRACKLGHDEACLLDGRTRLPVGTGPD